MENILLYGIITLVIIIILLTFWINSLSKRIENLCSGKNSASLETVITENNELAKKIKENQTRNSQNIENLKLKLTNTIQNISVVRFDALKNSGGLQSFAIGLTDNNKNGVVISSMYTRDRMNIFAKEIIKGESKHKLTDEEKQTIN